MSRFNPPERELAGRLGYDLDVQVFAKRAVFDPVIGEFMTYASTLAHDRTVEAEARALVPHLVEAGVLVPLVEPSVADESLRKRCERQPHDYGPVRHPLFGEVIAPAKVSRSIDARGAWVTERTCQWCGAVEIVRTDRHGKIQDRRYRYPRGETT